MRQTGVPKEPPQVRIGTRDSVLARWQTDQVVAWLQDHRPELPVSILSTKTLGDLVLDRPFHEIDQPRGQGGSVGGVFIKELENFLATGAIDLAVHSMKDVPSVVAPGMCLLPFGQAEEVRDVLVTREPGQTLATLHPGARIGTSALRRVAQIHRLRPDCPCEPIRGNVQTRLAKVTHGEVDAIILAGAGLKRLDLLSHVSASWLDPVTEMIPAPCQGILAVECRTEDAEWLSALFSPGVDAWTQSRVTIERAFLEHVEGGCQMPLGIYAQHNPTTHTVTMTGFLAEKLPTGASLSAWCPEHQTILTRCISVDNLASSLTILRVEAEALAGACLAAL
jgi:hydroxymethylbilane synthase